MIITLAKTPTTTTRILSCKNAWRNNRLHQRSSIFRSSHVLTNDHDELRPSLSSHTFTKTSIPAQAQAAAAAALTPPSLSSPYLYYYYHNRYHPHSYRSSCTSSSSSTCTCNKLVNTIDIPTPSLPNIRSMSTSTKQNPRKIDVDNLTSPNNGNSTSNGTNHPQSFVKTRLTPGEWDHERTDPLFRPQWKNRARIMSEEDFANRPRVTMEEQFASVHDSMAILSWLTETQRDDIYQSYLDLMTSMAADPSSKGITSHEYAMRVIAQKFNITANRVAAIVQLKHNEDQIRKSGEPIYDNLQEYVDAKVREHIVNVYKVYNEVDPMQFVEDPARTGGKKTHSFSAKSAKETIRVEDLYDIEDGETKAILREKDEAQLAIDGKIYIEDVDNAARPVNINKECQTLLKHKNELFASQQQQTQTQQHSISLASIPRPLPNGEQESSNIQRRPRWKYAAKTINTRVEKAKNSRQKKHGKKRYDPSHNGQNLTNILVEQDGTLRAATVEEVENTAWKSKRNQQEFTYRTVKNAWLRRQIDGEVDGWGRMKPPPETLNENEDSIDGDTESIDETSSDTSKN